MFSSIDPYILAHLKSNCNRFLKKIEKIFKGAKKTQADEKNGYFCDFLLERGGIKCYNDNCTTKICPYDSILRTKKKGETK